MPELLSKPVPHKDAARFLANKPVVSREVFDRLLPDLRARAFVITGVENANVVQSVRDLIAEVPQGADWDKIKEDVSGRLSLWLDQGEGNAGRAERRAELLLRQHGYQAYSVAQEEVGERQRAAFPYAQYLTSEDDRVRDSHAALNEVVLPADHPFWDTHTPPWEWGCRCRKVFLSEDDVTDLRAADAAKKPEERRVLDAEQLRALEGNGIIQRALPGDNGVPRPYNVAKRNDGFGFNPRALKMDAEQLRERYDPETWKVFEEWAKAQPLDLGEAAGRTVWEWMNKPVAPAARARRAARVAPVPPPPTEPEFQLAKSTIENERAAIREAAYKEEKFLGGGVNSAALLINGRKVVFKAKESEYSGVLRRGIAQGTQYLREVAASVIDEELGIGLVPPTTLLTRDGRGIGSAQLFRDGFKTAASFKNPFALARKLPDRVKHDWQLFEDLVGHLDRHGGNYMFRVTGDKVELALIDNGLSLSTIAQPKAYSGPLERQAIDATNLARLRDIIAREAEITERLKPYLERSAVRNFFDRARTLLQRGTYGDS